MSDTMNLTELLGKRLKDYEVLEVLESYAIEDVVYAFDRHDENTAGLFAPLSIPGRNAVSRHALATRAMR